MHWYWKSYSSSNTFPRSELYGLTSQIRRAALSIPANICEGCGRNTDNEFVRFLHIALGSAHETEYLLQLSCELGFLNEEIYRSLDRKVNELKKKLYHLEQKIGK
ncbi:four helix bundle protein [Siphonobacter aquaeclarae]|uniref:four helix bundle protein n=1 Tax=Siphonobacter aquaeclarae TaxID=563176 RepID=UPI001C4095B6|nr:four helix bundle protein [Siphonobacter aquaeclarae]